MQIIIKKRIWNQLQLNPSGVRSGPGVVSRPLLAIYGNMNGALNLNVIQLNNWITSFRSGKRWAIREWCREWCRDSSSSRETKKFKSCLNVRQFLAQRLYVSDRFGSLAHELKVIFRDFASHIWNHILHIYYSHFSNYERLSQTDHKYEPIRPIHNAFGFHSHFLLCHLYKTLAQMPTNVQIVSKSEPLRLQ